MNRLKNRLFVVSAGLAACSLFLTGCGAGQISQTANQESAVNGTSANVKDIALRNVHLLAVQSSDYLQPGLTVPLLFVAANGSPDVDDKLLGITSDVGTVAMTGTDQATALDSVFDLLDAATTVLNHNTSVRAGVVAALMGGDSAPEFVRDETGRWNVRVVRTMNYQIEEML